MAPLWPITVMEALTKASSLQSPALISVSTKEQIKVNICPRLIPES